MKILESVRRVKLPKEVSVSLKSRVVTVKGPRGSLTRSFKHMQVDMEIIGKKNKSIVCRMYFASSTQLAGLRTICTHIKNMITGVTKGFEYKMRLVYAHFPINANVVNNGTELEIRNYLGEKIVRRISMLGGVNIVRSEAVKDELVLSGNDIELVSQTAANIHQSCKVHGKDIRKFLDGIYVSEKHVIGEY